VLGAIGLSAVLAAQTSQTAWLGAPEVVASGVEYYKTTDPSLLDPPAPISVLLLRLDPKSVRLDAALSNDEVIGAEPVQSLAARHHAVAAINGGMFNAGNFEPVSLLKVAGELVSDTPIAKGVVLIRSPVKGQTTLAFDQASVRMSVTFAVNGRDVTIPVDGVDTTRARGKLMLYTPAYHADTDTAANGTDWILDGKPLKVVGVRHNIGRAPIPRAGAVLSFGGLEPPDPLPKLIDGTRVTVSASWRSLNGRPSADFDAADHIVGGAGLLRLGGNTPSNWQTGESLAADAFLNARHARTIIGVDRGGFIWLATIDGRQPDRSVGMTFAELERLCDRLGLINALNLDGGGSTTMVIRDRIVNVPADPAGARAVSDAILINVR
jgi:Phosphodiester glycosidase